MRFKILYQILILTLILGLLATQPSRAEQLIVVDSVEAKSLSVDPSSLDNRLDNTVDVTIFDESNELYVGTLSEGTQELTSLPLPVNVSGSLSRDSFVRTSSLQYAPDEYLVILQSYDSLEFSGQSHILRYSHAALLTHITFNNADMNGTDRLFQLDQEVFLGYQSEKNYQILKFDFDNNKLIEVFNTKDLVEENVYSFITDFVIVEELIYLAVSYSSFNSIPNSIVVVLEKTLSDLVVIYQLEFESSLVWSIAPANDGLFIIRDGVLEAYTREETFRLINQFETDVFQKAWKIRTVDYSLDTSYLLVLSFNTLDYYIIAHMEELMREWSLIYSGYDYITTFEFLFGDVLLLSGIETATQTAKISISTVSDPPKQFGYDLIERPELIISIEANNVQVSPSSSFFLTFVIMGIGIFFLIVIIKMVTVNSSKKLKTYSYKTSFPIKKQPHSNINIGLINKVLCGVCGLKLEETDLFCAYCGTKQI